MDIVSDWFVRQHPIFLINDEQNSQQRLPGYFLLNGRIAYERAVPGGALERLSNAE